MIKLFLPVLVIVAVALALLSINILLKKNGSFRSEDVGQSKAMRRRGISCFRSQDRVAQLDKHRITDMMK